MNMLLKFTFQVTVGAHEVETSNHSYLRQIQFHILGCVLYQPMCPLMTKHRRPLERILFQVPYMDRITVKQFFIQFHFIYLTIVVWNLYAKKFLEHSSEI